MKKNFIIVFILFIQFSCNANISELKNLLNYKFLNEIKENDSVSLFYCEQDYGQIYNNDSIGINDFIGHLICSKGCFNHTALLEDYFGYNFINSNARINLHHLPAVLLQYKYVPKGKEYDYLSTAMDYYLNNQEINKCYGINMFFSALFEVRKANYQGKKYWSIFERLYGILSYDKLLADYVLDTLRKLKDVNYINGKYFLSEYFNSQELQQKYKELGDFDFEKYIK